MWDYMIRMVSALAVDQDVPLVQMPPSVDVLHRQPITTMELVIVWLDSTSLQLHQDIAELALDHVQFVQLIITALNAI